MKKYIIPILIVLLLVSSGFVGVSNTADESIVNVETTERDELLDNLAFYCLDASSSTAKYEFYKEQLLKDYSNNDIEVEEEEITIPVESPQTSVSSGPMDSPWSMKCHDNHHTSRSPYSTANVTGLEKWRFRCDGVDGSPIIGDDGTIYFGDKDYDVYAIYPNGTLKWTYHTDDWITSAPALAEDGTLYVGSWGDSLYAFNSTTGVRKWKLNLGDTIGSSPAIGEDGTIYVGDTGGRIWAVNPNGTKKWYYSTGGGNIWGDPAIGDDGTIYIGTWFDYFYAINPNGTLKWRFKTGDIIKAPPSISVDGTVYIGSFDGYLYALYPNNGTMKWKCKVGYGTETNPSIANDGTIYIGGEKLYAIYPNGTMKWSFDLGSGRHIHKSSPAISADGTIYVGTNIGQVSGGDIIAVNPDGTERWRKLLSDEWVDSSPCIGEDGTVYIGSQCLGRGYIHAFGAVESNSPPETPSISGKINGKVREDYWYTFRAVDPDNNPISWYIEWGDGTNTGWTSEWASEENCYYEHKWLIRGTYTIRCKAKDTLGEESDWGYLEVTMPMNQQTQNWWFLQFLQNHPRMFPILQKILDVLRLNTG